MKTVFLLVADTGAGKDSIAEEIAKQGYKVITSYCTRPKRPNEGDTHIFITQSEVEQYKDQMCAYTKIGEFEYFTTFDQLSTSDIYIIDPNGVDYLKQTMSKSGADNFRFITIYINVPFIERYSRAITTRKDSPIVFMNRIIAERQQFSAFRADAAFDYSVCNFELDKAVAVVGSIMIIEREEI